jgi:hypothetical protein
MRSVRRSGLLESGGKGVTSSVSLEAIEMKLPTNKRHCMINPSPTSSLAEPIPYQAGKGGSESLCLV